jgi:hypothetical protein
MPATQQLSRGQAPDRTAQASSAAARRAEREAIKAEIAYLNEKIQRELAELLVQADRWTVK